MTALLKAYRDARVAAISAAPLSVPPGACRYCGRRWAPWAGSALDGHGRCVVTDEFKAQLNQIYRADPKRTISTIAVELGVSRSVVDGWLNR